MKTGCVPPDLATLRRLAIWILLVILAPATTTRAADALYDVARQAGVMVPMRDEVPLATDVFLPARDGQPLEGKWPTILMRTPYGKIGREPRRRILRGPRLRVRGAGYARTLQVGGRVAHAQ